jgi:hypothetical protein
MPRHIAIYKRYATHGELKQGKDYQIITRQQGVKSVKVTILEKAYISSAPFVYASEWEFLQDWQILRTWRGKK